jgi:hypothetical protein
MNLVSEQVNHKKFGLGVISKLTDDTVYVEFGDDVGQKAFSYPDAFEKYLTLVNVEADTEVKVQIKRKLAAQRAESAAIERVRQETMKRLLLSAWKSQASWGSFIQSVAFARLIVVCLRKKLVFSKAVEVRDIVFMMANVWKYEVGNTFTALSQKMR